MSEPIAFIKDFINQHGGRLAGSQAETNAQADLALRLKEFCKKVEIHPFEAPLDAKFFSLKIFCLIFYITLAISFFNNHLWIPIVASVNSILFLGHFVMYKDWLNVFFPKKLSHNVLGTLEPLKEVKMTIIMSGHMDNVKEFWWWYHLKTLGAKLTLLSGLTLVFWPLFLWGKYLLDWHFVSGLFLILSPSTLTFFFMHGSYIVDGAQDNLSGIATAFFAIKAFLHPEKKGYSTLNHVRLKILSFGAEETGTNGSKYFAKHFQNELEEENTILINLDGIKDPEHFTIFKREVNPWVAYPKRVISAMEDSFKKNNVPFKKVDLMMGGTDAHRFHKKGIPAISITAQTTHKLDPTYHTRLDTVDQLDPLAIEKMIQVLKTFILFQDQQLTKNS